jgi:hypothetical protein
MRRAEMVRGDMIGRAALDRPHRQGAEPDDLLRRRAAGVILAEQAAREIEDELDLAGRWRPVLRHALAEAIDAIGRRQRADDPRRSPRAPNRRRLSATAALPLPHVAR